MNIFIPLLISFCAGLSTIIGGLIVYIKIKRVEEFIVFCLSFSISIMIGISALELIPNGTITLINELNVSKGLILAFLAFLIGILIINAINKYIKLKSPTDNLYRVGILNTLALMIHNFPEGIATFMSSYNNLTLGINLGLAIMMHNIPEGISISVPIYYSTGSKKRGVIYSLISGITEPIGAIICYILLKNMINDLTLSIILILVSGIMITISINEILPEALKYNKNKYIFLGLVNGVVILIITYMVL